MNQGINDFEECEALIQSTLSPEQRQVLDGRPIWKLNPPQREEYLTPKDYVRAMGEYANRMLGII